MKRRSVTTAVPLIGALLMVWVLALVPVAAAGTKLPKVTYTVPSTPNSMTVQSWSGDSVLVYYTRGSSPVDPERCELYINGTRVPVSPAPQAASIGGGNQIQFPIAASYSVPKGDDTFRVVLVTQAGERVDYSWKYKFGGAASTAPSLVNFTVMRQWGGYIAKGGVATVYLTVVSIAIAVVFALLGALGRLAGRMGLREAWDKYHSWGYVGLHTLRLIPYWIATFYTSLFRGTPLLLQIFVIYYAVPAIILWGRARWGIFNSVPFPSAIVSGIAALSLNYGAYLTEVFRAGIQAVPKGQTEAAWALGLSGSQTQRRIILPQAFKIVIPAVGNDFIALIKDTSLLSTIAVDELLHRATLVGGRTFNFLSALLVAAAVYWALTIFFSFWQARLERRMERDRARA